MPVFLLHVCVCWRLNSKDYYRLPHVCSTCTFEIAEKKFCCERVNHRQSKQKHNRPLISIYAHRYNLCKTFVEGRNISCRSRSIINDSFSSLTIQFENKCCSEQILFCRQTIYTDVFACQSYAKSSSYVAFFRSPFLFLLASLSLSMCSFP